MLQVQVLILIKSNLHLDFNGHQLLITKSKEAKVDHNSIFSKAEVCKDNLQLMFIIAMKIKNKSYIEKNKRRDCNEGKFKRRRRL